MKNKIPYRITGIFLVAVLILASAGIKIFSMDDSNSDSIKELEAFREEFYSMSKTNFTKTNENIDSDTIEQSNMLHLSQEYVEPIMSKAKTQNAAGSTAYAGPYKLNDTRKFYIYSKEDGSRAQVGSKVIAQGEHSNIWIVDDNDFHNATGTIHNENTCAINETIDYAETIANEFDSIYKRMTDDITGFGAHENVIFDAGYLNLRDLGDLGKDGKINILLYDLYADGNEFKSSFVAGGFSNGDFFCQTSDYYKEINYLDMVHIDIGINHGFKTLVDNPNSFYGFLSHEFQHMLFYMYAGHKIDNNHSEYLWFNEALSALANAYYTVDSTILVPSWAFSKSASNEYRENGVNQGYGDFVNFNGSMKNYGMSYLNSIYLHKATEGKYASKVYNILKEMQKDDFKNKSSDFIIGSAIKNALGQKFDKYTGNEVFNLIYYTFMESIASDGGKVDGIPTAKFLNTDVDIFALWQHRKDANDYPVLTTTGDVKVELTGYAGNSKGIATHEKFYKLDGKGKNIAIEVADSDNALYYLVVADDNANNGAELFSITPDTENIFHTNYKDTYLFISTLYKDIKNLEVNFEWENDAGVIIWDTLTANGKKNEEDTSELELTFIGGEPVNLTTADVTVVGATLEGFSGTGNSRKLKISDLQLSQDDALEVKLKNPTDTIIAPLSKKVIINKYEEPLIDIDWTRLYADGASKQETSTKITVEFSEPIQGMINTNFKLSSGSTGAKINGTKEIDSGSKYEIYLTGIKSEGSVELSINPPNGYNLDKKKGSCKIYFKSASGSNSEYHRLTLLNEFGGEVITGESGNYLEKEKIAIEAMAHTGYKFAGWKTSGGGSFNGNNASTLFLMPNHDVAVTACFEKSNGSSYVSSGGGIAPAKSSNGGGGSGGSSSGNANSNNNANSNSNKGTNPNNNTVQSNGAANNQSASNNKYLISKNNNVRLNKSNKFINGYTSDDGTILIKPDGNVSRAEIAQMIYSLVDDSDKSSFKPKVNLINLGDISNDAWYGKAVSYLSNNGILNGYNDGNFYPNNKLTRAEAMTILSYFISSNGTVNKKFIDLDNHWAKNNINVLVSNGYISGYEDGTIKPDSPITRAEIISMINRILEKSSNGVKYSANDNKFSDLTIKHWAFNDIIIATT